MMRRVGAGLCALGLVVQVAACGRISRDVRLLPGDPPAEINQLWQEPANIQQRDLFHGPGGRERQPRDAPFTFVARDTTGWSPGFDVRGDDGTDRSVKLGPEAQSEVVTSRILWAIGFHQPPTYYLERWTLKGIESGPQPAGRFRPSLPNHKVVADWSWYENPFVGSRPFGGLMILNSWDWKTSNNKVYGLAEPINGVRRRCVVRDLGASLGKTAYPRILEWFRLRGFGQGTRNDLPGLQSGTGWDELWVSNAYVPGSEATENG